MIISDNPNHKVDVVLVDNPDKPGWLQITSFHLESATVWKTKIMRLAPETVVNLVKYIEETGMYRV